CASSPRVQATDSSSVQARLNSVSGLSGRTKAVYAGTPMFGRWLLRCAAFLWMALLGPVIGFIVGQRLIGADCQLSPTAGADIAAALTRAGDAVRETLNNALHTITVPLTSGGLHMSTDPLTLLLWLILAALAIAALAWWLRNRNQSKQTPTKVAIPEPASVDPPRAAGPQLGRE